MSHKLFNTINSITNENVELIYTMNRRMNGISSQENPILVIKIGPPGSGKSSDPVERQIEELGVHSKNAVQIAIDNVVEKVKSYRNNTIKYKKNINEKRNNTFNTYKYFSTKYMNTRMSKSTRNNKSIQMRHDSIFEKALENKKNIILETTGVVGIDFILENERRKKMLTDGKYSIYVIYPRVSLETLLQRVKERGRKQQMNNVPFYRGLHPEQLRAMYSEFQRKLPYYKKLEEDGKIDKYIEFLNE